MIKLPTQNFLECARRTPSPQAVAVPDGLKGSSKLEHSRNVYGVHPGTVSLSRIRRHRGRILWVSKATIKDFTHLEEAAGGENAAHQLSLTARCGNISPHGLSDLTPFVVTSPS